jgi:hypothetical protein
VGILGEETNLKITEERDRNKYDQHPNTRITFKRGYKCKGRKKR